MNMKYVEIGRGKIEKFYSLIAINKIPKNS